jgi:hypothetical protein
MTKLDSVGSVFDKEKLVVYPLNSDDTIDKDNGVGVNDLSEEWIRSLSKSDLEKLLNIIA